MTSAGLVHSLNCRRGVSPGSCGNAGGTRAMALAPAGDLSGPTAGPSEPKTNAGGAAARRFSRDRNRQGGSAATLFEPTTKRQSIGIPEINGEVPQ
ncbi:hypothetical protein M2281_005777 [Mesorhizobium soli]|nr:hypothetical protein [Mesorhizobium soli]